MREIEIKIEINDKQLHTLRRWLEKNAQFEGSSKHVDYYLDNPNHTFFFRSGKAKLKDAFRYMRIRFSGSKTFMCYKYCHLDPKTGATLYCDEYETLVDNGDLVLKIFDSIGFTEQTVIKKR